MVKPMNTVTIHEAKTHLSRLIKEALRGEEIIIAKGKKPLVRLTALPEARLERRLDGCRGLIVSISDDFDAPLADFNDYMP
jgi:prevent-host-death family protein